MQSVGWFFNLLSCLVPKQLLWMNHPLPYGLCTHHLLGLINKRLSLFYVFERIHASQLRLSFQGFSDAIRALTAILVISRPYRPIRLKRTDDPYQQPPVLNPPTTRISELGEDRSEGMPWAWSTLPQSQSSTCRMNDPPVFSRKLNLWHNVARSVHIHAAQHWLFLCKGSLRKQYRSDGSLQTDCGLKR